MRDEAAIAHTVRLRRCVELLTAIVDSDRSNERAALIALCDWQENDGVESVIATLAAVASQLVRELAEAKRSEPGDELQRMGLAAQRLESRLT